MVVSRSKEAEGDEEDEAEEEKQQHLKQSNDELFPFTDGKSEYAVFATNATW